MIANLSNYGNHFIVGLSGPELNDSDREVLSILKPAAILLLARNFNQTDSYEDWLNVFQKLISDVKSITKREKLIISIDHEGGRVHRVPRPLTHFPSAARCTKRLDEVTQAMAIELKSIGVNVLWGPVLDIHSNPENPVIGERAFGRSADEVLNCALPFYRCMKAHGITCCGKHFPGHGDTSVDSHLQLPVVSKSLDDLRTSELKPFQALIGDGIPLIMTAHVLFPLIDSSPATLSSKTLRGILRKELGFCGVVVSDDLHMKAVASLFKEPEAITASLNAGCDMFVVARHPEDNPDWPLALAANLEASRKSGALKENLLLEANNRVTQLLEKLVMHEPMRLADADLKKHAKICNSVVSKIVSLQAG